MLHLVKMAVGIESVHHLQAVQKKRLKGNLDAGLGPGRVSRDHSLAPLTTFKVGGPADLFLEPRSADEVQLELPETGVCSTDFAAPAQAGCCGGPPKKDESACCARDESMRAVGGCGCSGSKPAPAKAACCA